MFMVKIENFFGHYLEKIYNFKYILVIKYIYIIYIIMQALNIILFLLILLIVIIIIRYFIIKYYFKNESFSNPNGLYPIRGLQNECSSLNLNPSFMPKACYVDGNLNNYSNCKCQDDKGNCKICYPEIKKDSKNSSIVYNANVIDNS